MPIDIEGWIEVRNSISHEWNGVEDISSYLIFAGVESDRIFGITKVTSINSLAANRGLPIDISSETNSSLDEWREFEKEESNFSFDELFGFTHITYEEIIQKNILSKDKKGRGWARVFETMDSIYNKGVNPEDIRVVLWAIW